MNTGELEQFIELGLWLMVGVHSFSVLGSCTSHCSCLFLCMVVRSRIRVVQMDNLGSLLGIRRMDKAPNA